LASTTPILKYGRSVPVIDEVSCVRSIVNAQLSSTMAQKVDMEDECYSDEMRHKYPTPRARQESIGVTVEPDKQIYEFREVPHPPLVIFEAHISHSNCAKCQFRFMTLVTMVLRKPCGMIFSMSASGICLRHTLRTPSTFLGH
jgi:hypothetical protein